MENIPEEILDWIEQYPFEKLDTNQQARVKEYLGAEAYADMRKARADISACKDELPEPSAFTEERLMQAFSLKHKPRKEAFWLRPLPLWQAAASWALLLGVFIVLLNSGRPSGNVASITRVEHDTVLITKISESIPQFIHDTIYLVKEIIAKPVEKLNLAIQQEKSSIEYYAFDSTKIPGMFSHTPGFRVVPLEEKDRGANRKEGFSAEEDSLLKGFGFVTL